MDQLFSLTQQGERPAPHNEPASEPPDTEPGQVPGLPAAPSMSEAPARQPLLQALPPPAPAETVRSSPPTLAVGGKRSATDAGLEADPNTDAKRVKVSHTTELASSAMPEQPAPVASRKRNAPDASLDEDASPASKRLRQDEPGGPDSQHQSMLAGGGPLAKERMPAEATDAGAVGAVEERIVQRPGEMPISLLDVWLSACPPANLQKIQTWLRTPGIDVNAILFIGETALHRATKSGSIEIVRALLATPGIDVNAILCTDETALHVAARWGSIEIVQALLAAPGIDIDARDRNGRTSLDVARLYNHFSIIEALLEAKGFKTSAKAFLEAESTLESAIERRDIAAVESLLAQPWIALAIDKKARSILHSAIWSEEPEIVRLIMVTPGMHADSETAIYVLRFAISTAHLPLLKLLQARPDYDANARDPSGRTVLMDAVRWGNLPVVQALLAGPGIDPAARDNDGRTALRIAVEEKVPSIIDALLAAQGVNGGLDEFLARHREFLAAAKAGNLAQVRSLLADLPWLDVNFTEIYQTALKLAAGESYLEVGESHLEVVQELLATPGIVVDRKTCAKIANSAARKGYLHLLRLMLDRPDFDVNQRDVESYERNTPYLVSAAENGHLAIVQALLAVPGIDINAVDHNGTTALASACRHNHHQIAMALAALSGINVRASYRYSFNEGEYQWYTPLMFAAKNGNLPLVRVLLAVDASGVNDGTMVNFELASDSFFSRCHNKGLTSLMLAAYHGHLAVVQALLAMPGIEVDRCSYAAPRPSYGAPYKSRLDRSDYPLTALSLAEHRGRRQIVQALLAMPVSEESVRRDDERKARLERAQRARPKPEKKQAPEQTYRFLRQILHPGFDAGSLLPLLLPDQQRPSWLEQKCIDVSLGTCPVTDVPFLLKSTLPLPAWCQAALANAVALGFTAGHYRSAPDPLWHTLQHGQAWLAGLAFGAKESRQEAIELDAGIGDELQAMGLWKNFLDTVEYLRKLKDDIEGIQLGGLTLLGCAARDGDLPMIRCLAAIGANIHLRSANGDAPILTAAKARQWPACAELLSLGAMPYMTDGDGYPTIYHVASAFATSDTASPALAKLIRYLRLKNVRFDIPVPNPDEQDRKENPTVPVSDILMSNPETWILFGKDVFGIRDAPLPAPAMVPAPQPIPPRANVPALFRSANAEAAVTAWLDEDPQRLHWQDPDNGQGLLHLAAASQNVGLVRLLLDRGIARTHADHAGQTAAQLLPADYMSSHTAAAASIAALLR